MGRFNSLLVVIVCSVFIKRGDAQSRVASTKQMRETLCSFGEQVHKQSAEIERFCLKKLLVLTETGSLSGWFYSRKARGWVGRRSSI